MKPQIERDVKFESLFVLFKDGRIYNMFIH